MHIEILYIKIKVLLFKKYTKNHYVVIHFPGNGLDSTSKGKKGGLMPRNRKFGKTCERCGIELTTLNISKNSINDKIYVCFDCMPLKKDQVGHGSKMEKLLRIYDPNAFKVHANIDVKANKHLDRMELIEEAVLKPVVPKEKLYPSPKGHPIIIRSMEIACKECGYILTTTNADPYRVKSRGRYICSKCEYKQEVIRDTDPLYKDKRKIRKILTKIYGPSNHSGRKLKQFTWEYVEKRFAKVQEPPISQIDQEVYDKTVKLFGEAYAVKRYKPKTTNALQKSFGDLSSRDGCKRLLALFEYELYKLRNRNGRKQTRWEVNQYLEKFDAPFRNKHDVNKGITSADSMIVFDIGYQFSYYVTSTKILKQENRYK